MCIKSYGFYLCFIYGVYFMTSDQGYMFIIVCLYTVLCYIALCHKETQLFFSFKGKEYSYQLIIWQERSGSTLAAIPVQLHKKFQIKFVKIAIHLSGDKELISNLWSMFIISCYRIEYVYLHFIYISKWVITITVTSSGASVTHRDGVLGLRCVIKPDCLQFNILT